MRFRIKLYLESVCNLKIMFEVSFDISGVSIAGHGNKANTQQHVEG